MVNDKMKKLIFALIALTILVSACSGPSELDMKKAKIIGKILEVNKVPYVAISSNGDSVEINYETSDAIQYDAQLVSDWGFIFATAAMFNYSEITIVNMINYEPTAKLTTSSENVNMFANGEIDEIVFWEGVEIKAVD